MSEGELAAAGAAESAPTAQKVRLPHGRRWLFGLAAIGLSAAVALLAAEVLLRALLPVTDVINSFWDPVIGARTAPNQTGRFVRGNGAISARFAFNSRGWNQPREYAVERSPETARVCLIGDSFVEALQVDANDAMSMVGQRAMVAAGHAAEWYAFGCSGFGLAQYYLTLRHYVLDYRPDVVIVLLVPNDVYDSSPFLVPRTTALNTVHVDADGAPHVLLAAPFEPPLLRRVAYASAIVRFVNVQHALFDRDGGVRDLRHPVFLRHERAGLLLMGSGLSVEERWKRSWKHAEDVLRLMRDLCRGAGSRLLLVYCGENPALRAAYAGETFVAAPPESDPYCMNERIWEMGVDWFGPISARLEVPYIDLTAALAAEVRRTGRRHDFGAIGDDHYSELGHRVAGEAMARWVLTHGDGNVE
ncbi:MAG: hypothetical protein CHACPFDD_02968 [Phycisphaerae bacterium]|nr:hypothetical protein [Phycisphaerae bacterium]